MMFHRKSDPNEDQPPRGFPGGVTQPFFDFMITALAY